MRVLVDRQGCEVEPGASLFECAERVGLSVTNSCRKEGRCRECLVEVVAGAHLLSPPTEHERHLRGDFRLACRARIAGAGGTVSVRRLRRQALRILDSGAELEFRESEASFDPAVTRREDEVLLDGEPIARAAGRLHGLALDLGTTTVVLRLVDLESGIVRAAQSFENPQRFAGSDVMARVAYAATDVDGRLRTTLTAYINQAIGVLPCDPDSIYEVAVVGNPTMRDLFFGLDVGSLGQSPYRSVSEHELAAGRRNSTALSAPARSLGLRTHGAARAYGLPLVGGHVGADAAACLLAVDAPHEDRLVAVLDIGTNTELLLGNRRRMLAASCPAGPAFEGGGMSCGSPAFPGAIEAVQLDVAGVPTYRVIGDGAPEAICGSGLVDTLSELLRIGRMSELGRIEAKRYVLDRAADIYVTAEDISRLAQAKAALAAGWKLLMSHYGAEHGEIDRLYLAGGFANHLDREAAVSIGLVPDLPRERIEPIGNGAIEGATLALRSVALRRQLESFVTQVKHIELETDERFFDAFAQGCLFRPIGPGVVES